VAVFGQRAAASWQFASFVVAEHSIFCGKDMGLTFYDGDAREVPSAGTDDDGERAVLPPDGNRPFGEARRRINRDTLLALTRDRPEPQQFVVTIAVNASSSSAQRYGRITDAPMGRNACSLRKCQRFAPFHLSCAHDGNEPFPLPLPRFRKNVTGNDRVAPGICIPTVKKRWLAAKAKPLLSA